MTASLCPYLVSHFNSSLAACTDLGLCGSECECGVCTKSSLGLNGRCLGAPNSIVRPSGEVILALALFESDPLVGHCFDGQCDQPASVGCCLAASPATGGFRLNHGLSTAPRARLTSLRVSCDCVNMPSVSCMCSRHLYYASKIALDTSLRREAAPDGQARASAA